MDPWVEVPPDPLFHNIINCYGIIEADNNYFQVCDLLEDDCYLPTQKNQYEQIESNVAHAKGIQHVTAETNL